MSQPSEKSFLNLLLLFQILIAFVVGIFGNKIAEVISISLFPLVLCTVLFLVASYFLASVIATHQDSQQLGYTRSFTLKSLIPNRIITIIPLAIIVGSLTVYMCIIFTPNGDFPLLREVIPNYGGFARFELTSSLIAFFFVLFIHLFKRDNALNLAFSMGFSFGVSSTILLLRPSHRPISTILGWLVVMLVISVFTRSKMVQGLANDIQDALSNVTKIR